MLLNLIFSVLLTCIFVSFPLPSFIPFFFTHFSLMLSYHYYCFLLYFFNFILSLIYNLLGVPHFTHLGLVHPLNPPVLSNMIGLIPHPWLAWQGTDLMHNHVLADVGQSYVDAVGCRSSGFPSDQSEDSDYDTIWITHTNRIGSMSRKSCCSYIQIHIKMKTLFLFFCLHWKWRALFEGLNIS